MNRTKPDSHVGLRSGVTGRSTVHGKAPRYHYSYIAFSHALIRETLLRL
jgi:hypothetical protein